MTNELSKLDATALLEDSLDLTTVGKLQVTAGVGLLRWSHLILLDPSERPFKPNTLVDFTSWRGTHVDPTFGRLVCWVAFSVGAEYLGKGVCLLNGLSERISLKKSVLSFPSSEDVTDAWAEKVCLGKAPTTQRSTYGTIDPLVYEERKTKVPAVFDLLASKLGLPPQARSRLIAGYRLLASAVRNRDAHFYTPGVREAHFYLVEKVFVPSFNILADCVPGGGAVLSEWLSGAPIFISGIFE